MGIMAAMLVLATYPAYATDIATSAQDLIDIWTDIRNSNLIKAYFEESYPTPDVAAVETVKSAIELYEATRAEPQVQVRDRGNFVQHPINPYGTQVVAFEVINSMHTNEEIYPFVIDAGTLKMLAEGAFPGTVGLYATFLNDADRSMDNILEDLQESDGTWVSYTFNNPDTDRYDVKHVWLSLYDGYIFGSGYYEAPDDRVSANVASMVNMYDTDGADSFANIHTDYGVSFVLDAVTLDIVSHTDSDVTESAIKDALDINWRLEALSEVISRHGSLWVSYSSPDPHSDDKYVRAYLQLHDGHIFGSGYGITTEVRIQSLTDEAIQLYELEGENAYPIITSMEDTLHLVTNRGDNVVLAAAGRPNLVGHSLGSNLLDQAPSGSLQAKAGLWIDNVFVSPSSVDAEELRRSSWLVLHGDQLFTAGHIYSPEIVAIDTVNSAIDLYKTHGTEAFDRITWQSINPEIIYPFVVDTQTWELLAHAAVPERVGVCCAAPIAASNDLVAATKALEQNPGIWLDYTFYNPVSDRYEYKRTWLSDYDGYTFAAGYYYGNFDQLERVIQEAISIYDTEGSDTAFAVINAMRTVGANFPIILDSGSLDIVAHGQNPNRVGSNFLDRAPGADGIARNIEANLNDEGDTTIIQYSTFNPATNSFLTQTVLLQLHDGYIFAVGQPFVVYTR